MLHNVQTKDKFLWMILACTVNNLILFVSLCGGWILSCSEPFLWFPLRKSILYCGPFFTNRTEVTEHNLPHFLKVNFQAQAVEIARQCVQPPLRKKPKWDNVHICIINTIFQRSSIHAKAVHTHIYICIVLGPLLTRHETVMYTRTYTHTHTHTYIYTHSTIFKRFSISAKAVHTSVVFGPLFFYHA